MIWFSLHTVKQFQKFAVVGITNTAIGYSVFFGLFHFVHFHYLAAAVVGYVSGLVWGFFFNRRWTFRSAEGARSRQFIPFGSVYLVSLLLSMLLLRFLVAALHMDPRAANIVAIGLSTLTNFAGCKLFVFRHSNV